MNPSYHGLQNDIIRPDRSVFLIQTVADTGTGANSKQRMIARLAQNRDGNLLPTDLVMHSPVLQDSPKPNELLTLLDLDHYREHRHPFDIHKLMEIVWELHDGLDVLFRDVVTTHALNVWK